MIKYYIFLGISIFIFSLLFTFIFIIINKPKLFIRGRNESNIIYFTPTNSKIECFCLDTKQEQGVKLSCNHTFHKDCIEKWININPICPICRKELLNIAP